MLLFIVHLRWPHVPHEPTSMKTTYLWVSFFTFMRHARRKCTFSTVLQYQDFY